MPLMSVLLPLDPQFRRFKGYLSVAGVEYGLEVVLDESSLPTVLPSPELASLLVGLEKVVESKARACRHDMSELAIELTDLCERVMSEATHSSKRAKRAPQVGAGFFARIVQEIQGGLDLVDIGEQMDEVKLRAVDAAGRETNTVFCGGGFVLLKRKKTRAGSCCVCSAQSIISASCACVSR